MARPDHDNLPLDSIEVELPTSLWTTIDISLRRQSLTIETATHRLIDALGGLSKADIWELTEPRKERTNRSLALRIGHERKVVLERCSSELGLSRSSFLRRILFAFFVSREIALFGLKDGSGMQLRRTQMHFEFAENYECDGPISPLSRQHPEPV